MPRLQGSPNIRPNNVQIFAVFSDVVHRIRADWNDCLALPANVVEHRTHKVRAKSLAFVLTQYFRVLDQDRGRCNRVVLAVAHFFIVHHQSVPARTRVVDQLELGCAHAGSGRVKKFLTRSIIFEPCASTAPSAPPRPRSELIGGVPAERTPAPLVKRLHTCREALMTAQTNAYPPAGEIFEIDKIGGWDRRESSGSRTAAAIRSSCARVLQVRNEQRIDAGLLVRLQAQDSIVDIGNRNRAGAPNTAIPESRAAATAARIRPTPSSSEVNVGSFRAERSRQGSVLDRTSCGTARWPAPQPCASRSMRYRTHDRRRSARVVCWRGRSARLLGELCGGEQHQGQARRAQRRMRPSRRERRLEPDLICNARRQRIEYGTGDHAAIACQQRRQLLSFVCWTP